MTIYLENPIFKENANLANVKENASDNKYLMVVMDYVPKWPEILSTPNQGATTRSRSFIENVIMKHGLTLERYTDQSQNFESEV